MKVVAKGIEVISHTDCKGNIKPIRFRLQADDESTIVIKVDKIITKDIEKLAGNIMLVYRCQSLVNNVVKQFEIKYELQTCKWILFKM